MTQQDPDAVLVTGVYGSGKTTAIEQMAAMLEEARLPFAAIDLDWMAWVNLDDHGPESHRLLLDNLRAVVANDRASGMTRFLFAGTIDESEQVADLAAAADMPVRVVRLAVPVAVVVERLSGNPTSGRQDDLEVARRSLADGSGSSVGDLVVDGTQPVSAVAAEILGWLGWLPPTG